MSFHFKWRKSRDVGRYEVEPGIIIDNPSLVKKTRKFTEFSLGVCGWLLWVVIMRPLFLLAAWYLTYRFFKFEMFYLEGIENPGYYLRGFAVIVVLFLMILGWNRYNAYRFRGVDRRKGRGTADDHSMAAHYGISENFASALKDARFARFHFPEPGKIEIEDDGGRAEKGFYNLQSGG